MMIIRQNSTLFIGLFVSSVIGFASIAAADSRGASKFESLAERRATLTLAYNVPNHPGTVYRYGSEEPGDKAYRAVVQFIELREGVWGLLAASDDDADKSTLYVMKKDRTSWNHVQRLRISDVVTGPENIGSFDYRTIRGFYTQITGAASRISRDLYAFDPKTQTFLKTTGAEMEGALTSVDSSSDLVFGYTTCGSADACWISTLGRFEGRRFKAIARATCDGEKFNLARLEGVKKIPLVGPERCAPKTEEFFSDSGLKSQWQDWIKTYQIR